MQSRLSQHKTHYQELEQAKTALQIREKDAEDHREALPEAAWQWVESEGSLANVRERMGKVTTTSLSLECASAKERICAIHVGSDSKNIEIRKCPVHA